VRVETLIVALCMFAVACPAEALIYCCNDDSGRRVCGNPLPTVCYGRAYVKRDGGRTEHFEAPLTAEQKAARRAEQERKQEEARLAAEEQRKLRALLATYPTETDIDRAKERAVIEGEKHLKQARERLEAAEKRQAELDKEAEFYRKGTMPADLAAKFRDLDKEILAARENVAARRKDIDDIKRRFDEEKERFRRATGLTEGGAAADVRPR